MFLLPTVGAAILATANVAVSALESLKKLITTEESESSDDEGEESKVGELEWEVDEEEVEEKQYSDTEKDVDHFNWIDDNSSVDSFIPNQLLISASGQKRVAENPVSSSSCPSPPRSLLRRSLRHISCRLSWPFGRAASSSAISACRCVCVCVCLPVSVHVLLVSVLV